MRFLVTGSSGLIGSEAVVFFDKMGFEITGVDNNMRADFFGPQGDTRWNLSRLKCTCKKFKHIELDIRHREGVLNLFKDGKFDAVVHCAAQPSHDLAATRPFDDFDVNAVGTLNMLEACRRHAPDGGGVAFDHAVARERLPRAQQRRRGIHHHQRQTRA